jgi:exopolysaccharide production protein ExoQ
MPSLQLVFQIISGLGPYFFTAISLAVFLGIFLPWGVSHPQKWLFLYIFGVVLLPFGGNDPDAGGSLYKQMTWGLLYVLCFVVILRSRKDNNSPKIRIPLEFILLYAFLFFTIAWSDYKLSSFKRYLLLVGLMMIAIISSKLSVRDRTFSSLVDKPIAFFMLCGAATAVAWPSVAFDTDGALRAFTSHKNTWGQFMLLCSVVFLTNVMARRNRMLYLPLLVVALILLYLSKSATSLLAFVFSTLCVLIFHGFSSKNITGKLVLASVTLTGAVAILVYSILHGQLPFDALIELVYTSTDKSSTLTGRTQLWQLMGSEIARHPWLGTGFGGFWVGLDGPAGALGRRLDWGPPTQAHSGYIDSLNEIGAVGMLLLAIVIAFHAYRCFGLYSKGLTDHFLLHVAILVSFLLNNYAESSLIQGTGMWWIIFTCSVVEVHNRLRLNQISTKKPPAVRSAYQF